MNILSRLVISLLSALGVALFLYATSNHFFGKPIGEFWFGWVSAVTYFGVYMSMEKKNKD